MSVRLLEKECFKGAPNIKKRMMDRRANRSERRLAKMALAQAISARIAFQGSKRMKPEPPVFYDPHLDIYFQFDPSVGDFIAVPWPKPEGDMLFLANERFDGFVHPINTKTVDGMQGNRINTIHRWLRTLNGKSWIEVYSILRSRFNHGTYFLWCRNVREFGREVEAADKDDEFMEFYIEDGIFRCHPRVSMKHMDTVIEKPTKLSVAKRLEAKAAREEKYKKSFREKRFIISHRKAKRQKQVPLQEAVAD